MFAYAVWGGGLGGLEDDFFFLVGWVAPNGKRQFLAGVGQCNVTYRKHRSVDIAYPWLSDWTRLQ